MGTQSRFDGHNALYFFAYLLFILKYFIGTSSLISPGGVETFLNGALLVFVLIKLAIQRYDLPRLLALVGLVAVCAYSSIKADYSSPMLSALFLFALQDVDLRGVIKFSCVTKVLLVAFHVLAYAWRSYADPYSISYAYRGSEKRHFFFLGHPNLFSACLVWICLEAIYVHYDKLRWPHLLAVWAVNGFFFLFTDSNTGLIVLTLVTLLIALEKGGDRLFRVVAQPIVRYGFAVCSVFFAGMTTVYPRLSGAAQTVWLSINRFLTGRLMFGAYAYDRFGATLLGRKLDFPSKAYWRGSWLDGMILDNTYQWMLLIYGGAFLVLLSVAFFLISKKLSNIETIVVIAYIFYAIMENYVVNVVICFPLLLIGQCFHAGFGRQREPIQRIEEDPPLWKRKSASSSPPTTRRNPSPPAWKA